MNGNKPSEGYYEKNIKNSLWINWNAHKKKYEIGHHVNNKEPGEWIFMSENGEKILAGFFSKGQKIQTWTHWYSERMKKKQIKYNNGIKISELCWDKMGNLINCLWWRSTNVIFIFINF